MQKNIQDWQKLSDEECNEIIDQYTMQSSLAAEQVLTQEERDRISEQKWKEEQAYLEAIRHDRIE